MDSYVEDIFPYCSSTIFIQAGPVKAQLPELNNIRVNFAYTFLDLASDFMK